MHAFQAHKKCLINIGSQKMLHLVSKDSLYLFHQHLSLACTIKMVAKLNTRSNLIKMNHVLGNDKILANFYTFKLCCLHDLFMVTA